MDMETSRLLLYSIMGLVYCQGHQYYGCYWISDSVGRTTPLTDEWDMSSPGMSTGINTCMELCPEETPFLALQV